MYYGGANNGGVMYQRKSELETGNSEPDWLREADKLIGQRDAAPEPDVIASVADGFSATQSLGIIFGGAADESAAEEAADDEDTE